MRFTRRDLLWLAAGTAFHASSADSQPLFEEFPPPRSGIEWVHDNAMSVEHYLPETLGPRMRVPRLR